MTVKQDVPSTPIDLSGLSVHVVITTNRNFDPHTVHSLLKTQEFLSSHGVKHAFTFQIDSAFLHTARSMAAHHFLKGGLNRMFWIDSDMVWQQNDFARVLALSAVADCVFVPYRLKVDPVTFPLHGKGDSTNDFGCFETLAAGLGFCCVRREVMEALAAKSPKVTLPEAESIAHIFRFGDERGKFKGEDVCFYEDVRTLGFSVWCDPQTSLGHIGRKIYEGRLIDQLRYEEAAAE